MSDIRILVVAADPLARAGLAALLTEQPGYAVVGRAAPGEDLSVAVEAYRPDVVLWGLGWDPGPALEQLAEQAEDLPAVAILAADAATAWQTGARALLQRAAEPEQMPHAAPAAPGRMKTSPRPLSYEERGGRCAPSRAGRGSGGRCDFPAGTE